MPNNPLVFNRTRNCRLSLKQARKAVDNCSARWVEFGKSIEMLTPAESIQARNQQAREREPIASSELPGIVFKPPIGAQAAYVMERRLAFEANKFASTQIQ